MPLLMFCIGFHYVPVPKKNRETNEIVCRMFLFSAAIPFIFALFIYFSYPFSDKLANISGCIKNNKCPENESKSFFSDVRFSSV